MPWRRRVRHNRGGITCSRRAGLLAILGITMILLGWLWHHSARASVSVNERSTGDGVDEAQSASLGAHGLDPVLRWPRRPVYPFSVIPGGVQSASEFRQALLRDPVVAAHYSDFEVSRSRILVLRDEKTVYVSYRIKDRIFWTSRRVLLRRGEKVITDGVNQARARCGNRISEVPQAGSSPHEPPPEAWERPLSFADRTLTPVAFRFFPPSAEPVPAGPEGAPAASPSETKGSAPASLDLVLGGHPPAKQKGKSCTSPVLYPDAPCKQPKPPALAPEPGTVLLIATGLGFLALRGRPSRTRTYSQGQR
jgi:hypothetical protein